MGNAQSRLYTKLWHALPSTDNHGCGKSTTSWFEKSSKPFESREDKDQFIYSTITVLSQNGTINLENHEIRLLYSRRENDRIVARIVSEKEGIVKAQIAPRADGKDQIEAFKALRNHVERCLERILRDVPGASMPYKDELENGVAAGPSQSPHVSPVASPILQSPVMATQRSERAVLQGRSGAPMDAPPAYGKAVREWRSGEEEKKS